MITLEADSVAEYLTGRGWSSSAHLVRASKMTGGVSNRVILAECDTSNPSRIVLKQARPQLEVKQLWECSIESVLSEMEVLELCDQIFGKSKAAITDEFQVSVPKPVFYDRENYVYAMTAAPENHAVWKSMLLAGHANTGVAAACGKMLGTLHADSWMSESVMADFDDIQFFDDLRLDPYYRQIARAHADLVEPVERLIGCIRENRRCLVHGDFSPKNLLVTDDQLILLDFEVGHFGDPAFDLGFFLTHLVIKSVFIEHRIQDYLLLVRTFLSNYWSQMSGRLGLDQLENLQERAMMNLGACLIARVDGKSPVEYLDDPVVKSVVRSIGTRLLTQTPTDWSQLMEIVSQASMSE